MTKEEFVFYTIELLPDENVLNPEDVWAGNDERDRQARQAFEAVFHMLDFPMGDKYSPFLYDAVRLYAISLNETITKGMDFRSGEDVQTNMKGKVFDGLSGSVMLDDNGDRDPNYNINDMLPNGTFVKIAEILNVDHGKKLAYHLEIGMTGRIVLDNIGDREPDYWITDMSPNGTFIRIAEVLNGDLGKRFLVLLGNYHFRQPFFAYNMLKFPVALKQIKERDEAKLTIKGTFFITFRNVVERIVLDGLADREPNYWITDMVSNGTFLRVAEVINSDLGDRSFSALLDTAPFFAAISLPLGSRQGHQV
ncbi:hypothetical protein CAPTEDRAFT_210747 [Capitella teleta]|uniref:Receptor ligand binding region domain-containing protein n=1 Tax=Capitella teleta TaxID=283909 RepID=R7VF71_CAPTE|nr:hypothetical protein CAPTEDRAFT_210747 [Capitella teleta]|eukprot:ELU14320.1 hypothetical protein CAPTEDRAFT_210747 [Capitella teleta]